MKYKNFPQSFWDHLSKVLDQELAVNPNPVAVFDADGTLWDTDLGESFFKWQIQNASLPNLPDDPWTHYRQMKASGDPRPAYLWLAQINQGQELQAVKSWAEENLKSYQNFPAFESQMELIEKLRHARVQVYVVTASVKWAVEPGAKLFNIDESHVLGVATVVENGRITSVQDGEITYKEGKIKALLKKTNGVRPFLASGNSPGDISLLENATRISLAVGACPPEHELYSAEESLRKEALKNSWILHRF